MKPDEEPYQNPVREVIRISRRLETSSSKFAGLIWITDILFILAFVFFYVYLGNLHMDSHLPRTIPDRINSTKHATVSKYLLASETTKMSIMIFNLVIVADINQATYKTARKARRDTKILTVIRVFAGQLDYVMIAYGNFEILQDAPASFLLFGGILIILEVICSLVSIYVAKRIIAPLDEFLAESEETIELISINGRETTYNGEIKELSVNHL